MKRCGIILALLVFAAACGDDTKKASTKYVFFDVGISGEPEVVSSDLVINTRHLLAFDREYQRPLVGGHAKFFANAKEGARKFEMDFAHRETEGSLMTGVINDWQPFPHVQVNGCQLGYADVVSVTTAEGEIEYRLGATAQGDSIIGKDCEGKLAGSLTFGLSLTNGRLSGSATAVCMVENFPNPFETVLSDFGGELRGTSRHKPWNTEMICNPMLPDGTLMITAAGFSQYGYRFWIQNYEVSNFDIATRFGFTGFLVQIDEEGSVSNILPHTPPPPNPVPVTSVTIAVRGYGGLQNPLNAYCDFNGQWQPVPMAMSYAAGTTIVVSQSVVFANVATNRQYACNFMDTVTGEWIYFPPPSTASAGYVFLANGVQVVEPAGNDLRISLDGAGQLVVTRHTMTFTATPAPGMVINPEVRLVLGNTGIYTSYPMALVNGSWQVSLSLPWGSYEANVVTAGGAYYWLTDQSEAGQFYVADATANMTLPGLRLDPDQDAIMYASSVSGPPPGYFIGHRKNYWFRVDSTGINSQNYLLAVIGIIIGP